MSLPRQLFKGWTTQQAEISIDWIEDVLVYYNSYWLYNNVIRLLAFALDRRREVVPNTQKQLWLSAAMLITSKFYQVDPIMVDDFVYISNDSFTRQQLMSTEIEVLNLCKWRIKSLLC